MLACSEDRKRLPVGVLATSGIYAGGVHVAWDGEPCAFGEVVSELRNAFALLMVDRGRTVLVASNWQ